MIKTRTHFALRYSGLKLSRSLSNKHCASASTTEGLATLPCVYHQCRQVDYGATMMTCNSEAGKDLFLGGGGAIIVNSKHAQVLPTCNEHSSELQQHISETYRYIFSGVC